MNGINARPCTCVHVQRAHSPAWSPVQCIDCTLCVRRAMLTWVSFVSLSVCEWLLLAATPPLQVSKHTFLAALRERGAVLFCPGGQAEMCHTWRAWEPRRELVLHTRHKGFCRCGGGRWAGCFAGGSICPATEPHMAMVGTVTQPRCAGVCGSATVEQCYRLPAVSRLERWVATNKC